MTREDDPLANDFRPRIVVLDDDPTGTQSATDVPVLLESTAEALARALRENSAVYVQTNTRALDRSSAVRLVTQIKYDALNVCAAAGEDVRFVLRGDSTLRGHLFAEADVFSGPDTVTLFAPAFPAGGRITLGGVQRLRLDSQEIDVIDTEYAQDPVFGYRSRTLADYVAETGNGRAADLVPLMTLRSSGVPAVVSALLNARPGSVVIADAATDDDLRIVCKGLRQAWADGRDVVVRAAAPLAALCANVMSEDLLVPPISGISGPTLVICGSHTTATTRQLERLVGAGYPSVLVNTDEAMRDPASAARRAAHELSALLQTADLVVVSTERNRRPEHGTLRHGEAIMSTITEIARHIRTEVGTVIAKGGITSAAVATAGLGARQARVRGQLLPGVSLWDLDAVTGRLPYVVVPGNVGDDNTLVTLVRVLGLS